MSRKSRLLNPSSTPAKHDGKHSPAQSEKSSPSVKTVVERDSLGRKKSTKTLAISSQIPSLPPTTPTRSLLHRIQRRSSTSAESLSSNQSSIGKKTIKTNGEVAQIPAASTPIPVKTLSKSSSTTSTVKGLVVGESKLPRQRKSISLIGKGNTSLPVVVGKIEQNRMPSQLAANTFIQNDNIAKRSSSMAVPPRTSKGSIGIRTNRRHSAMIPSVAKISPPSNNVFLAPSSRPITSVQSEVESVGSISQIETASQNSISSYEAAFEEINNLKSDPSKLLRELSEIGQNGLTRLAARQLEHEFSSQERILEGLQRDNEFKTIETEELKRKLARIEESCAKIFGKDNWRGMVYPTSPRPSESRQEVEGKEVENPNDLLVIKCLPETELSKSCNPAKKSIISHTRDSSGVETITDRVNRSKRYSSSNTSLAMDDPSYYTAAEASSSSLDVHLRSNGVDMVSVRKDLLMTLLQAQKQFTDYLHLNEDSTLK